MNEHSRTEKRKSNLLLIIALVIAAAVVVWIILSFDDQPGKQDGIGQSKMKQIMVAQLTQVNHI